EPAVLYPSGQITETGSGLGGFVAGCRLGSVLLHRNQADLAAVVDVGNLHADLRSDVDDVLDLGDALAVSELADVHETVAAGKERDERAEGGGLDDRAQETLADLRQLRVRDGVDLVDRGLCGRSVRGTDVDRS